MNLNELKKLAEAVYGQNKDDWELKQALYEFDKAASPQQVLKMIECMEMMAEALDNLVSQQPDPSFFPEEYMDANEALAAFDKLNEVE